MDILSHALWAGVAATILRRRGTMSRRDVLGAMAFGAAPDLVAVLPVSAWAVTQPDAPELLYRYVTALPGALPPIAPWALVLEHHFHCSAHSAIIAALVTLLAWRFARPVFAWTLGWWLHLGLDVPTHSYDYYPVRVFYPLTDWGWDGVAWIGPPVLAANYAALAIAGLLLWVRRRRATAGPSGGPARA